MRHQGDRPLDLETVEAWTRRRLAEQLHDGPVQDLTAAQLALDAARLSGLDEAAIDRAADLVRSATGSFRALLSALVPNLDDSVDLTRALRLLVGHVSQDAGVRVDLSDPQDPAVMELLHRLAVELVSNVDRHAGGALQEVVVSDDGDAIELRIVDRGPGGCPDRSPPGCVGLDFVRSWLRARGGTLDVRSTAAGTTVTARVPDTAVDP